MRGTALNRRRRVGQYKLHAAFKAQPPAGEERDCSATGAHNRLNRFPVACAVGVAPLPRMPRRRVRKCGPGSVSPTRARSGNSTPSSSSLRRWPRGALGFLSPPNAHPRRATSTVDTAQPPPIHLLTQHPRVSAHRNHTVIRGRERGFSEHAQGTMQCIYTGTARLTPTPGADPPAYTQPSRCLPKACVHPVAL